MVKTASGAGSGGLKIMGSIDTYMIERGFTRIKQSFASVKGKAKSFLADQHRMITASKNLAKGLLRVGIIGAAAITTLAKGAPAVAPALAQIEVGLLKLKIAAGEALAPAFEKVAGWLDKLAVWASDHPDLFGGIVISFTAIAALKFVGAMGFIKALGSLIISPSVLIALGYLAVIAGLGYAGAKVSENIATKTRNFLYEEAEQIPGTLPALRSIDQKMLDEIRREGVWTPEGVWGAAENDRRWFILRWWDAMWG